MDRQPQIYPLLPASVVGNLHRKYGYKCAIFAALQKPNIMKSMLFDKTNKYAHYDKLSIVIPSTVDPRNEAFLVPSNDFIRFLIYHVCHKYLNY